MRAGSSYRVAIVDDDPVVARSYARTLAGLQYEPTCFHTAHEALAAIPALRPDLILMDGNLGGEPTGFVVARRLLEQLDAPVLFLTGLDEPSLPDLGTAVYAFLPKPVSAAVLATTVRLLAMQQRARAEVTDLQELLAASQRLARIGGFRIAGDRCKWTDVMYELHGAQRGPINLTIAECFEMILPEDRAPMMGLFVDPSEERVTFEYRVVVDGHIRRLRGQAERLRSPEGDTFLGTVQDVTSAERAIEANRAKTEFLANMSHELRTPLNAVLGLSEALIDGTFGAVSTEQQTILSTVYASGTHLLELINDVLDISRVELGNLTISPAPVHPQVIVDEVSELLSAQFAEKRQLCVVIVNPDVSTVEVDRRRFKQALLNIVGNAIKFSPVDSTISITATADHVRRRLSIAVVDQGPGISPAERTRVFQPFVTLDASMTRSHGGVGLGLSLAKRIVELHGGTIEISTPSGVGSTFTITVPLSDATQSPLPGDAPRRRPAIDGVVVLVVEDNDVIAMAMQSYLESLGCVVRVARDGRAALLAADDRVDAIVMDVRLPEVDGLTVTRRIRARGQDRVPIIGVTAHALPGDEAECLDAGCNAYLPKPVSLRRLAETVESLLARAS